MTQSGADLMKEGISQSENNAESKNAGWVYAALEYVRTFNREQFLAEDVRRYAENDGLPLPPSKRAWGGVIVRAKKLGYIKRIGYRLVNNPNAHKTPATYWQKTV